MTGPYDSSRKIGLVGLGIIGGALARHLLAEGWQVDGTDPDFTAHQQAESVGVRMLGSAAEVASSNNLILTSLPSVEAVQDVMAVISRNAAKDTVVAEMSTLSLGDKLSLYREAQAAGLCLLDCPVSGTGAQAAMRDIVIYASGEDAGLDRIEPALRAVSREIVRLGAFGQGTKMKLVANLLVALHTAACAEAMSLATAAGLDLTTTIAAIKAGAGNSRIFELRAPMMAARTFVPATMKLANWEKDLEAIEAMALACASPAPLLGASRHLFAAAAEAFPEQDTAAVFEILSCASNLEQEQIDGNS